MSADGWRFLIFTTNVAFRWMDYVVQRSNGNRLLRSWIDSMRWVLLHNLSVFLCLWAARLFEEINSLNTCKIHHDSGQRIVHHVLLFYMHIRLESIVSFFPNAPWRKQECTSFLLVWMNQGCGGLSPPAQQRAMCSRWRSRQWMETVPNSFCERTLNEHVLGGLSWEGRLCNRCWLK